MAKMLGTVTKQVVARAIALSRAATQAEAEMEKGADAETPAQVIREVNKDAAETAAPLTMSRGMSVAAKAGRPTPATGIPMFMVYEGGRKTGEGTRLPASAQTSLRTRRANWLNLVVG